MSTRCLRFLRFVSLFGLIALLSSCSLSFHRLADAADNLADKIDSPHKIPKHLHWTTQAREVPDFQYIYVEGPFNIKLHTYKHQKASLKINADVLDLKYITSYVKNGVLYVSEASGKTQIGKRPLRAGEATLDINVPELHGITYKGKGEITGHRIHSSLLDIWLMNDKKNTTLDGRIHLRRLTVLGSGTTKITGVRSRNLCIHLGGTAHVILRGSVNKVNLKRIDMKDHSSLDLYWVRSKNLILRLSGYTKLTLAGTVHRLDGVFSDHSHFYGRYLRVKEAFVKTNGEAISDIAVVETQHTLARDNSDIYYYNLPPVKNDFMARNGSVLDMRPQGMKDEQEYTIYNH